MSRSDGEGSVPNTVTLDDVRVRDVPRRSFLRTFGLIVGTAGFTWGCGSESDSFDSDTGDSSDADSGDPFDNDPTDPVDADTGDPSADPTDRGDPADSD